MNWVKIIKDAIEYIEGNMTEDLTVGRIAEKVNTSAFYFQKGFSMLCGYTVREYVRMRPLLPDGRRSALHSAGDTPGAASGSVPPFSVAEDYSENTIEHFLGVY